MSLGLDINYNDSQFEYPKLTRIIGEQITAMLIVLLKEVIANVSSVHTDLGKEEDSHLGLVCSLEVYSDLVPEVESYYSPDNPNRLQLELGMTQYKIAQAQDKHVEETRVFQEVIGVEQVIW